jgi:predicted cobalt transporter CbtA
MRASRTACGRNLGLAVAACLLPTTVLADRLPVAPPLVGGEAASAQDEQRSAPLPLRLEEDEASPVHRIVIPAAVLAKLAGMPLRSTSDTAAATIRSVVAGIALSVAVGCGLVAFRRGRPIRIAAVVLIGLALAGGGGVRRPTPICCPTPCSPDGHGRGIPARR